MPAPADFQDEFTRALLDPERSAPAVLLADGIHGPRGFDVYRNNRVSSLIDALATTYPAVQRLVGEAFFRAAARVYIQHEPPRSPILNLYGAHFGDFLDAFPPAGEVCYLGDVARLEWSCLRAHHAPDAHPLEIQALASVPEWDTPSLRLGLHPSLALHRSKWPVGSLWSAVCGPASGSDVDMTNGEDVLVIRPELEVAVRVLPAGAQAFISELGEGETIEQAARRADATCDDFDLVTQLQGLFGLGAVVSVHAPEENT